MNSGSSSILFSLCIIFFLYSTKALEVVEELNEKEINFVHESIDNQNKEFNFQQLQCDELTTGNCTYFVKTDCQLATPHEKSTANCRDFCDCTYHKCRCTDCHDTQNSTELIDRCLMRRTECLTKTCKLSDSWKLHDDIAVFSTDIGDNYFFFTPITAINWYSHVNYIPFVFVVVPTDHLNDPLIKFVLDKTREVGGIVHVLPSSDRHKDSTVAQVSRLYAAQLPFHSRTYLLTSDVDMWILDGKYFHQRDMKKSMHLFGNIYPQQKGEDPMFPMCYLGMSAHKWRTVMNIKSTTTNSTTTSTSSSSESASTSTETVTNQTIETEAERIHNTILRQIDQGVKDSGEEEWHKPGYGVQWYYDQKLFGQKLGAWKGYPKDTQIVTRPRDRQFLADRLDRGKWKFDGKDDFDKNVDCHLLRPGYNDLNWNRISMVLKEMMNEQQFKWLQDYRDEYVRIKNSKS